MRVAGADQQSGQTGDQLGEVPGGRVQFDGGSELLVVGGRQQLLGLSGDEWTGRQHQVTDTPLAAVLVTPETGHR